VAIGSAALAQPGLPPAGRISPNSEQADARAEPSRHTTPLQAVAESAVGCEPDWQPLFGQEPGTGGGNILAACYFDDGSGPAIYVAGEFSIAGGVPVERIARWNGAEWSAVGDNLAEASPINIAALEVFDDGSGPALYAAGQFDYVLDNQVVNVMKWDGSTWSDVGRIDGPILDLEVFDDGSGPALYAGGTFGFSSENWWGLAKWDGVSWVRPGIGVGSGGRVYAMKVYDDGAGPALYVGGEFDSAGGVAVNNLAKWDGSSWSDVGGGVVGGSDPPVRALEIYDDGQGESLFVGGIFQSAGGIAAANLARWDGAAWSSPAGGINGYVAVLRAFQSPTGPVLLAGGNFTQAGGVGAQDLAAWDGAAWSPFPNNSSVFVDLLEVADLGDGPTLYGDGGGFFGRWNGAAWERLGEGVNNLIISIATMEIGSGPALFVGGGVSNIQGVPMNSIGMWDGEQWSSISSSTNGSVYKLFVHDDGSGMALYAGGSFGSIGGLFVPGYIARWRPTGWSRLSAGLNGFVYELEEFDDGTGPALFAGGSFTDAGFVDSIFVAKWDGTAWSSLDGGMSSGSEVRALEVFDDGTGPALFAGGFFRYAGGAEVNNIAKWDGTAWSALGTGINGRVRDLVVYDDGTGPALYVAGYFDFAGGITAEGLAKWDGATWSAVPTADDLGGDVLAVFNDGTGDDLYMAGFFDSLGGVAVNNIAKWNGTAWSPIGNGLDPFVRDMHSSPEAWGATLFIAGGFRTSPPGDSYLAAWAGCPVAGDLTGDGLVNGVDLGALLGAWGPCAPPCVADLTADGVVDGADLGLMLGNWTGS
jgi:hypothetical protein